MSRTAILENVQNKQKTKEVTKIEKIFCSCKSATYARLHYLFLLEMQGASSFFYCSWTIGEEVASSGYRVFLERMSARRRSITVHGMHDESLAELEEYDELFYGDAAGDDESDESDDSSDDEPSARRIDYGGSAAAAASDMPELESVSDAEEEFLSESEDDDEVATAATAAEREEQASALVEAEVRDMMNIGCGCQGVNHYAGLEKEGLETLMTTLRQLDKKSLKLYILGELAASIYPKAAEGATLERRFKYSVMGITICKRAFWDIHGVNERTMKALKKLAAAGTARIVHGNIQRSPHNILSADIIQNVVRFLHTYGNLHGLPQPAAPRGRPGPPPVYLSASHKKGKMHEKCNAALAKLEPGREISYRSFRRIWTKHVPDIRVMKRRTDVCAACDRLRENVSRARTEEQTTKSMADLKTHLDQANSEREFYRKSIAGASSPTTDSEYSHYTMDFAQQLELPSHTREVGPLYFKVKYRVQLFGIAEEARHQQYNFLFGEQHSIGLDGKKAHGPNSVLSMLHYFLDNTAHVKPVLRLHADNCTGQNKNKTVLAYLAWRCATGLSDDITLSFMRVGHTRCAVDGYFGLIKQKWRSSDNDTLEDVDRAVSSSCAPNEAVMHAWPWLAWDQFLPKFFTPLKGILGYQHFHVTKDDPGHIGCRKSVDGDVTRIKIARAGETLPSSPDLLPEVLVPPGLSEDRRQYLDKEIAPYISAAAQSALPWNWPE